MVDHYHIQECIIVQLAIACPSGGLWCSQEVSPHQCMEDPVFCMVEGKTNKFGYPAHFDLLNNAGQVDQLGWDNIEVTFEPVDCSRGQYDD